MSETPDYVTGTLCNCHDLPEEDCPSTLCAACGDEPAEKGGELCASCWSQCPACGSFRTTQHNVTYDAGSDDGPGAKDWRTEEVNVCRDCSERWPAQ